MTSTHVFEPSFQLARAALSFLEKNQMPASPRNYSLMYAYMLGDNPGLNTAFDTSIARNSVLTQSNADDLYNEFIAPSSLEANLEKIGSDVTAELNTVLDVLNKADTDVAAFGNSIEGAASDLNSATSINQFAHVLKRMILASRNMEANNRQLKGQLAESGQHIGKLQDRLEQARAESLTDPLTGLANRKHFDQALDNAICRARANRERFCLMLCDIDHFKVFNDRYGHLVGDQVLKLVGEAFQGCVRDKALAARYGGEEFAFIVPQASLPTAVSLANHIRKAINASELISRPSGQSMGRITLSFGVARLRARDDATSLIARADACLYISKQDGRDRVTDESTLNDNRGRAVA